MTARRKIKHSLLTLATLFTIMYMDKTVHKTVTHSCASLSKLVLYAITAAFSHHFSEGHFSNERWCRFICVSLFQPQWQTSQFHPCQGQSHSFFPIPSTPSVYCHHISEQCPLHVHVYTLQSIFSRINTLQTGKCYLYVFTSCCYTVKGKEWRKAGPAGPSVFVRCP